MKETNIEIGLNVFFLLLKEVFVGVFVIKMNKVGHNINFYSLNYFDGIYDSVVTEPLFF